MTIIQFFEVFIVSVANAVAQVILKKAGVKSISWEMFFNKFVWAGAILYVSAFWLWVKIINEMEMGVAIPFMVGIMYVLTLFAAWYFFEEQITVLKFLGIFLIFLGIIFLVRK